ncbi:MAG: hypothetical protein HYX42_10400 [Polaromonas sp.]|uniref:hypothetical protein n=1 Tax=Polaromonas sp. TaxID=1869339 RepID=UPI0025DB3FE6|nr:hypothetical protein [Polaromonas sp.]MBI2726647.1 hypothetical protein [Polaromonas sp.]
MSATLSTRKPIDQLSVDDLTVFPIWEFAMDEEDIPGQDETWVRPVAAKAVPLDASSLSVAAEFRGPRQTFEGFLVLSTDSGWNEPHGAVLLHDGRYLPVSFGNKVARSRFAKLMDIEEDRIFPLQYVLRVRVDGEPSYRQGVLE